jgi:uncharacterized protein YeaO (DUF488 family)
MIRIDKTVYDPPEPSDGKRVLVMRIWPRGVPRDRVHVWLKELGTQRELISEWKAGRVSWEEFRMRYLEGLRGKEQLLRELAEEAKKGTITLLCSCRDAEHCHRYLLKEAIEAYLG